MDQVGRQPMRVRKFLRIVSPWGVWATSGWNWTAKSRREGSPLAATGPLAGSPSRSKRGGGLTAAAARPPGGPPAPPGARAGKEPQPPPEPDRGPAVLAPLGRDDPPPQEIGHGLHPVADAEDRQPGLEE